jgi:ankyrin repeat protein
VKGAQALISEGQNVNVQDSIGRTALHISAAAGAFDLSKLLLDQGAEPTICDKRGRIPLHYAVLAGSPVVVEELLHRASETASAHDIEGNTALHLVMQANKVDAECRGSIVNALVANGADVNAKNKENVTPLQIAAESDSSQMVALLLKGGKFKVDVNTRNRAGETSLYSACWEGRSENALMLCESGADPNASNNEKWTPLHAAASKGHIECCRILLKHGGEVNIQSSQGTTPVYHAAQSGFLDVVKLLHERGANLNLGAPDGWRPLHIACSRKHFEVIQYLTSQHVELDPICKASKGYTPLHMLVMSKSPHLDAIKHMLRIGANPNVKNTNGMTALHLAAYMNRAEVAEVLVGVPGIELRAHNKERRTPLEVAASYGYKEVAIVLCKALGLPKLPPMLNKQKKVTTSVPPKAPPKPSDP